MFLKYDMLDTSLGVYHVLIYLNFIKKGKKCLNMVNID